MLKRISDLDFASFEQQIRQKCNGFSTISSEGVWKGDAVFGIQRQIIYDAEKIDDLEIDDSSVAEAFFWNDLVCDTSTTPISYPHAGYDPNEEARAEWLDEHPGWTFADNGGDFNNGAGDANNMPLVHAAKCLIEVSEYIGESETESNYVSRKLSMLWLFNAMKAIADICRTFKWIDVVPNRETVSCAHSDAESDPNDPNSQRGRHTFQRSSSAGELVVGGNAQFNGQVSTFHSQTRFHGEVRVWDSLNVYGQSYFSKDINGTAMYVRWADLAEYYAADEKYLPGTLVKFGGEREITLADENANAVVTMRPGLVLNDPNTIDGVPVAIALAGRVPVKVFGAVRKFDRLCPDASHPGLARTAGILEESFIRALEDGGVKDGTGVVLCAVNFKI